MAIPTRQLRLACLLVAAIALAVTAGVSGMAPTDTGITRPLEIRGADISFTPQEEAAEHSFTDAGATLPVERILAHHGANYARLRVWVAPPAGYSDEGSALAMARRAHAAGLRILLDLHYSDFWADASSQTTPRAWQGQGLVELTATVRGYTARVVADFARQGTPVDMVQIGNEITAGLLWPLGKLYRSGGEHWAALATLLNAGIAGARQANPAQHRLAVMLHLDRGGDNGGCRYFLDHLLRIGVTGFDVIGLTYYPFWNGRLSDLRANLDDLAERYGKPLLIAETAYPWTLRGGDVKVVRYATQLPDGGKYPPTPQGQAAYFLALRDILAHVPNGRGWGFFDWAPEWLAGVGAKPGEGDPFANLTMFDEAGAALPALQAAFRPRP